MAPKQQTTYDYSGLEKGMRVQAESDGAYYAAEIVTISTSNSRAKAPVKVSFKGYEGYDEWVSGDRLRSKALKRVGPEKKERLPTQLKIENEIPIGQVARVYRAKVADEAAALKLDALVNTIHAKFVKNKKEKTKGFVKMTRTVCKTEWAYEISVVWRTFADFEAYKGSEIRKEISGEFETKIKEIITGGELYSGVRVHDELGMGRIATDDKKISDLMKKAKPGFFSFEYFPPKTADGVTNLKKRITRMKQLGPVFVDFTWGAGGSTSDLSLDLTSCAKNDLGCVANMHLTCTNQTSTLADEALAKCRAVGVRNICALRGDPPRGSDKWEATEGGFQCALDLVKRIRQVHGNYFTVSVACYPEGHPDNIKEIPEGFNSLSETEKKRCRRVTGEDGKEKVFVCRDAEFKEEMKYLKKKVDAGSDFVITQMFLDPEVYVEFLKACKEWKIKVPIIPGIMCLTGYGGFNRMTDLCKTRLPAGMAEAAKAASSSDDEFKNWGIKMGADLCKKVLAAGAPGLHFYTLNLERVAVGTLLELGFITAEQAALCQKTDADAKSMVSAQGITVDKK